MDRSPTWGSERRRKFLQLSGLATVGGLLTAARGADAQANDSFVLEQGDRCLSITPLSGSDPVEDLYDYTYPARYDGPPGSDGNTFSSEGTTDLQRDATSILFLYDGPDGMSLVMVHGRVGGERDPGGTVTFTIRGLPTDGEWIVRDDYYLVNGEPADSNYDRWDVDGDTHTVDWAYISGRTDGGAFRDVGTDFDITIEPAFNDNAALAPDHDVGPIEAWEILSGDRDAPDRYPLRLDRPVTIRQGTCEADGDGGTGGDGQDGSESNGGRDGQEQDGDDEENQNTETKHQKKQRKHQRNKKKQKKHEKKQEKHEKKQEKHEKKQEKHEKEKEKHEKKQKKHEKEKKKHEKKQEKHEKKKQKHKEK